MLDDSEVELFSTIPQLTCSFYLQSRDFSPDVSSVRIARWFKVELFTMIRKSNCFRRVRGRSVHSRVNRRHVFDDSSRRVLKRFLYRNGLDDSSSRGFRAISNLPGCDSSKGPDLKIVVPSKGILRYQSRSGQGPRSADLKSMCFYSIPESESFRHFPYLGPPRFETDEGSFCR